MIYRKKLHKTSSFFICIAKAKKKFFAFLCESDNTFELFSVQPTSDSPMKAHFIAVSGPLSSKDSAKIFPFLKNS